MIIKIFEIIFIGISSFLFLDLIKDNKLNKKISKYLTYKNEKYYQEMLKNEEKKKYINLISKFNVYININKYIRDIDLKPNLIINPLTIILICIMFFIFSNYIIFKIFQKPFFSFIVSLPTLFIPIIILKEIGEIKKRKIEKVMLNFLLQLKNYTQINNDIIYAFKNVKTIDPLKKYIQSFLIEINSGIKFEKAIENLGNKIPFKKFKMLIFNLKYCYLYGGNFSELMNKSYNMIYKIQNEKNNREQETLGARIVLIILIALNLFIYFNFIKSNYENYKIMTKSILGNLILYWNFISIWILFLMMNKVKKLDY